MPATRDGVIEEWLALADARVFLRRTEGDGVPTVFVHGNPTSAADWLPFIERVNGPAIALDLPGWGRTEVTDPAFDFSMNGLGWFMRRFLDAIGEDHNLVCHDWGVVALIAEQRRPQALRKLVVVNSVPLLPGYRWHWVARWLWRRRGLGELANATTTRMGLRLLSRQATATPGGLPREFIDAAWEDRHPGTWPEMLALYRSADPAALEAAGARLAELDCPALVLWGSEDPYLPVRFGRLYAGRLPNAELRELPEAGHWPWIDRPEAIDEVVRFLDG